MTKWTEPVSKLPSRTRLGDAQTAEALFRVFGMDIPVNHNIEDDYEFDARSNSMDEMFTNSKTNELTDHREMLDVMEEEFLKHVSEPRTAPQSGPQPQPEPKAPTEENPQGNPVDGKENPTK